MKIVIATGIFAPDIGGPAVYSQNLSLELKKMGFGVKIITYSDSNVFESQNSKILVSRVCRKYPKGLRHLLYFWRLLKLAKGTDVIYAQNIISAGLPAFLVAKLLRKKFVLRFGGDVLWEKASEKNETELSLKEYYQSGQFKKKKFLFFLSRFILKHSDLIIFPTIFLRDLYFNYYSLRQEKAEFIDYPFPEVEVKLAKTILEPKQILFAGRLIRFKNLARLIEAFAKVRARNVILKIVGAGPQKESLRLKAKTLKLENRVIFQEPLKHSQLLKEIQKSYLVVIPSIFEPGSFLALECLKLKTPVLFTKEAGLYEVFRDKLIFINPFDVEDIKNKIEFLLVEKNWHTYLQKISQIDTKRSWHDVAEDHIKIFKKLLTRA